MFDLDSQVTCCQAVGSRPALAPATVHVASSLLTRSALRFRM